MKNSRGEIVKMIDETGKMFVSPAYQKRKEKAYSTLQSVKSITESVQSVKSSKSTKSTKSMPDRPVKLKTPKEHTTPPRTAKVVTGETLIDPTKL